MLRISNTPELDDNGLVVARSLPECNPECCPVTQSQETCFVNNHHLYWPAGIYHSEMARRFRERPENIVPTDFCQHRSRHDDIDGVPIPSYDVMATFVEESVTLEKIRNLRSRIGQKQTALLSGLATKESVELMLMEVEDEVHGLAVLEADLLEVSLVPDEYIFDGHSAIRASFEIISDICAERLSYADRSVDAVSSPHSARNRREFFAAA